MFFWYVLSYFIIFVEVRIFLGKFVMVDEVYGVGFVYINEVIVLVVIECICGLVGKC